MSEVANSWDEVLGTEDTDYVEVPAGSKTLRLGSVSGAVMLEWFANQEDPIKAETNGLWLVAQSLVDKDGKRIGKVDEVTRLREKNPRTMRALIKAAVELNGLQLKLPERKNESSETVSDVSPISSPSAPTE